MGWLNDLMGGVGWGGGKVGWGGGKVGWGGGKVGWGGRVPDSVVEVGALAGKER